MMKELTQHIKGHQNDIALRVIVMKAEGPVFSAGHNLKELVGNPIEKHLSVEVTPEAGRDQHQIVFRTASELMLSIVQSPVPVLAAVSGLAAAAGCQLVAGCDLAICTESSLFSTPGAMFGIFCSTPGIPLIRSVPHKVAADMLFTARAISAEEALQHGLVSRVIPDGKLDDEVSKMTETICSKSRNVLEIGKKFLYTQLEQDLLTAYRLGESVMVSNLALPDGQEGTRSFAEKRKPQWKHQ